MSDHIYKILINLRILGKVKENNKIYINECDDLSINKGFFSSLVRWVYSIDRKQTSEKIAHIIDNAILESNRNDINVDNNKEISNVIDKELNSCIYGIKNLIVTYRNDQTIISFLEILIERIERHLAKHGFKREIIDMFDTENIFG